MNKIRQFNPNTKTYFTIKTKISEIDKYHKIGTFDLAHYIDINDIIIFFLLEVKNNVYIVVVMVTATFLPQTLHVNLTQ